MEFQLDYGETHLIIKSDKDLRKQALDELIKSYSDIVSYINSDPLFKASYEPVKVRDDAPEIVKDMADAAKECDVGPMAAVAGAIAEKVASRMLSEGANDVLVENGGDIYVKASSEKKIGIYAGQSRFSGKLAFKIMPEDTPIAVCTSSGSVGHSVSMGNADSATVLSKSAALADAAATALANMIKNRQDIESAISKAKNIRGVMGCVIVAEDRVGAWGKIPELARLNSLKLNK